MKKKIIPIGAIIIIFALLITGCTSTTKDDSGTNSNNAASLQQNETEIRIPISNISTTAKFYSYESKGITIRYFAVKDNQGTVHTAFDACDVCFEAKKGYKQNGDVMQCINCGKTFSITSIGTDNTVGGCWPSYLPMYIDGTDIEIKIADLEAKSYMF